MTNLNQNKWNLPLTPDLKALNAYLHEKAEVAFNVLTEYEKYVLAYNTLKELLY